MNQSLSRRGNLGHKAEPERSGRIISLMKCHYLAFVPRCIVDGLCSAFNPLPDAAATSSLEKSDRHVGGQVHGWKVDPRPGERSPRGCERRLGRCGWGDFNPSGSFFKSAILGSSPAHFKHPFRPFVSLLKPNKSATWKENSTPGLILLGKGGANMAGMSHRGPPFSKLLSIWTSKLAVTHGGGLFLWEINSHTPIRFDYFHTRTDY